VEPPGLPPVGGTPALPRVRPGSRRRQGNPNPQRDVEDAEDKPGKGESSRKGRNIDERA
jgi:hypothetical protein